MRLALAAFLFVLLLGAWLYSAFNSRTPVYQGKTSAEWFAEFRKASSRFWVPLTGPSARPGTRILDLQGLRRDPSALALRALGTNAALYLGREYARQGNPVARHYARLFFKLPAGMRTHLPAPRSGTARFEIAWALEAIGLDAAAAAPAIIKALPEGDASTISTAVRILQKLRFDKEALNPVIQQWTRQANYSNVVLIVTELQPRSQAAATCLACVLAAGDLQLRRSSAYELEKFGPEARPALAELTAALADADSDVRYAAARALEAIGTNAAPAIPGLLQATNDTSEMVQRASARALRSIQGHPPQ